MTALADPTPLAAGLSQVVSAQMPENQLARTQAQLAGRLALPFRRIAPAPVGRCSAAILPPYLQTKAAVRLKRWSLRMLTTCAVSDSWVQAMIDLFQGPASYMTDCHAGSLSG